MRLYLFTLVCDIGGGTYCTQVQAADPEAAVREWASAIRHETWVGNLSALVADEVLKDLNERDFPPVALKGLSGVWCMSGSIDNDYLTLNIVKSAWAPNTVGS